MAAFKWKQLLIHNYPSIQRWDNHSIDLCSSLVKLFHLDELDETVEFLLGIFVFVSFPRDSDSDLAWNVPDTIHPDVSVQFGVNANILRGIRQKAKMVIHDTFQFY